MLQLLEDLVEVGRAKLLELMYEGLLEDWFRSKGYRVSRDVRKDTYKGRRGIKGQHISQQQEE